ncbi:MAG: hypothetical protein ACRD3Q_01085 [Terriglobales bacterium]
MRILLGFLLGAICMACVSASAKTAKQPLIVNISAEAPAVKTGPNSYTVQSDSHLFITVHLTNISKRNTSLSYDKDSRTNVDFCDQYEVRDAQGNAVQKRPIDHPEIESTGHGWPARILKPGGSTDITGDFLSRLYDLSQPGEYTIQLSRIVSDSPRDGVAKSNTITVYGEAVVVPFRPYSR